MTHGSAHDAVRSGLLLGWLSVAAVLIAVALGLPVRHDEAIVALALAAGLGNGLIPVVLNRLAPTAYLDLWAAALLVFVAALMVIGGAASRFDLLLFLVLPFIAVTHESRRLAAWLTAAAATFAAALALAPAHLRTAEVALHVVLLSASVILAVALARGTRRSAAAAARAEAQAELEQALLAESHHRIKNSLQTVADLLLLGRPANDDTSAAAFDATAARIRSIGAVHHLLAGERGGTVAADELLKTVVAAEDVTVVSDDLRLHSAQAQQLAMIAGELLTNAVRHGGPPVQISLHRDGEQVTLTVRDGGTAHTAEPAGTSGLGLTLVRQIAERGLQGSFALDTTPGGPTTAVLRFNVDDDAHPDRRGRPGHRDRSERPPEGARA
ncbi:sensor histidine kinase [Solirubrobacter ginsenosidimutans]|uniref:histidine kinase n=1 Tax=Solirubrobacter ginsenosidimutans TaxID=490573 RepID=A0A9X3MPI2_9ACTN|nr:sensor histidine kinase [Solirubrobacter ginsenosidimutans]MDA0160279.1 sensor histidine kinase [Solirubrobacter ginsenosidimutans]